MGWGAGEDIGDCGYGNLTNNIAGAAYSRNVSITRVLCFDNLLQTIQITRCFPIIKSIPRSFKWTCSWAFRTELFSELPQFGRKLIQRSFLYCACWIRGLNARQSFLLQSEILGRVSSISSFSPRDASLPLWTTIEREVRAESCTSKNEKKEVQKMSRSIIPSRCLERQASPSIPASPTVTVTVWYDTGAGGWVGAGCHSPIGLVCCCLKPTAFSYGNVWLSSWKMVKYFAKLPS